MPVDPAVFEAPLPAAEQLGIGRLTRSTSVPMIFRRL
jgi:hypothetical protein